MTPPINSDLKATHEEDIDTKSVEVLAAAISKAIGENQKDQRFIDITRIPLICLSITGIHENIKELKEMVSEARNNYVNHDQFKPISMIVYGLCALILTGFLGALIALVIKK